jgi:hypothetical protein
MRCDILIHTPSGVAYSGRADEDKFIGSPAVLLSEQARDAFEATLASDALTLTWKKGKEFKIEKIPYGSITSVDLDERRQSEVASAESVVAGVLGGGILAAELYLTHVSTLKVNTEERNYEIFVPDAQGHIVRGIRSLYTT